MRTIVIVGVLALGVAACDSYERSVPTLPPISTDSRDPSVARLWNEVLLQGIRNDFARPTVHA
ncbi:MAG: hypothetical protein R3305_06460, partial [Gammaproteobacteria bacterium]|nr:hypothetical protein [Gammaproteobacteria bacterium]